MKIYHLLFIILFFSISNLFCQSFSIYGGIRPNNLLGSHFSAKADVYKKRKWVFGLNYSFIKYTDSFARPFKKNKLLHIENKNDETFINFPELFRGYAIQINERDFRPRDLVHRICILGGFEIFNNRNFKIQTNVGVHYSFRRSILYNVAYDFTPIIIKEGDTPLILQYHDFQIYRSWDIGWSLRCEIEYKLFKNLNIGVNSQFYNDLIGGSLDLVVAGGLTFNFKD